MNFKILLTSLFMFSFLLANSQTTRGGETSETSNCGNFNAFLTSTTIGDLQYYTESISSSGAIKFDLTKSGEFTGIDGLYPLLGVETGNTFVLVRTTPSQFDENKNFFKYQQYYQGIKVLGGGYTVSAIGGTPSDPCAATYSLSPGIHSGINVNTTPSFPSSSLGSVLTSEGIIKSELVITLNQLGDCQYHLAWRATYHNGVNKESFVDANTGTILETYESDAYLIAPTVNYGEVNLDDTEFPNFGVKLITNDQRVKTYQSCPVDESQYFDSDIRWTQQPTWEGSGFLGTFQTHYVAQEVLPVFDGIGIVFQSVDIAFCNATPPAEVAKAFNDGDMSTIKAFIKVGQTGGGTRPFAVFDVVAHEMTHSYLFDFFGADTRGNKTLHEGIAEMISAYVESEIQGYVDWVAGDDDPNITSIINKDMSNPPFKCYEDVKNNNDEHARSGPLQYWFYLISAGSPSDNIPALGIKKAAKIVLESLNHLQSGSNFDYIQFRDATLEMVDNEYGICSSEGVAIRSAWQKICIPTITCGFNIVGPEQFCEEDDHVQYCISGGPGTGVTYRWYFPYGWTVPGSSGNSVEGNCLTVTNLPKYNWYPRYFKITVKMLNTGLEHSKNIRLKDCLGDDPTCEEFNALDGGGIDGRSVENEDALREIQASESTMIKAYDISGRLIYFGEKEGLKLRENPYSNITILSYFDKNGNFIKAEKIILRN